MALQNPMYHDIIKYDEITNFCSITRHSRISQLTYSRKHSRNRME